MDDTSPGFPPSLLYGGRVLCPRWLFLLGLAVVAVASKTIPILRILKAEAHA